MKSRPLNTVDGRIDVLERRIDYLEWLTEKLRRCKKCGTRLNEGGPGSDTDLCVTCYGED